MISLYFLDRELPTGRFTVERRDGTGGGLRIVRASSRDQLEAIMVHDREFPWNVAGNRREHLAVVA